MKLANLKRLKAIDTLSGSKLAAIENELAAMKVCYELFLKTRPAGRYKLWADKNYKIIVETAERLPESVIQEDNELMMYYDISLGRV